MRARDAWAKPASVIWSSASALARALADRGWLRSEPLGARVVSVGNLQAGGAGKTPIVTRIGQEAQERGLRIWILTRGYGGSWERGGGLLIPGDSRVSAKLCGDEPALLRERLPDAWIGVGSDREAQYRALLEKAQGREPDIVVLDDGFQHWKIQKDVELVAVDTHPAPGTVFRDHGSALARADLVVWTRGERRPDVRGKPCVKLRIRSALWKEATQAPLAAKRAWLVTTVASAHAVRASIAEAGYEIAAHAALKDHAELTSVMAEQLLREAQSSGSVIAMTGKDWVKWREVAPQGSDRLVFEPELEILEGREDWNRLLWGC